ncbi:hypothetical protein [Actinomadura sp. 7K507]|uniref:hypothetical protein n=1 Tax=Actinomadura sp. 7K507 TaxID=2530365 RepID=UPI00104F3FAA|nr:hypothetical protein [Actinomadura sp. 7K507]TDC79740.1 hypothetical protein E1285_35635 [Actinomadura sp. 7K507]
MDDQLGPVVVHRTPAAWIFYCRADKIAEELAMEFEALANRYSQATVSITTPTEPRTRARMHRLSADQMPAALQPAVVDVRGQDQTTYVRADLISEDMAEAMAEITAEQNRYGRRLPVIGPSADS